MQLNNSKYFSRTKVYVCAIVVLEFFCMPFFSYAQKSSFVQVGFIPQIAGFYNEGDAQHSNLYRKKTTYCNAFNLQIRSGLTNSLAVNYGIVFSEQFQKFEIPFRKEIVYGSTRLTYIKVPVLLELRFLKKKRVNLLVDAGPQLSMLFTANGAVPVFAIDMDADTIFSFNTEFAGNAFKELVLDGVVAAYVEFKFLKNIYYSIGVRIDYGFTNIENRDVVEIDYINSRNYFDWYNYERGVTHKYSFGLHNALSYKFR